MSFPQEPETKRTPTARNRHRAEPADEKEEQEKQVTPLCHGQEKESKFSRPQLSFSDLVE